MHDQVHRITKEAGRYMSSRGAIHGIMVSRVVYHFHFFVHSFVLVEYRYCIHEWKNM